MYRRESLSALGFGALAVDTVDMMSREKVLFHWAAVQADRRLDHPLYSTPDISAIPRRRRMP